MKKNLLFGHIEAMSAILIWSTTFVQTKILLAYLTPVEILIFRFSVAFILLYLLYPKSYHTNLKDEIKFIGLGLSGIFMYYILENESLVYTQAANVGLLVTTSPLLTAILAHFFLKNERFSINLLVGFFMAAAGVALLVFNKFGIINIGDLLAFLGALSFGAYSVLLNLIPAKYHYLYVTRKSFLYGLIFMLIYTLLTKNSINFDSLQKPVVFLNLLFLSIFASGICFVLWKLAVDSIGSVATSTYIYLTPLLNAVAAVVILKEKITHTLFWAGFLIIGGLFVSQKHDFTRFLIKKSGI